MKKSETTEGSSEDSHEKILCIKKDNIETQRIIQELSENIGSTQDNSIRKFSLNLKQELFNDKIKKIRECGHCHKVIPYSKFPKVGANDNTPRPYCKKCLNDIRIIRLYKKKIKVVNDFGGKCIYGGEGIEWLPALSFHHLDPNIKTIK